MLSARPVYGGEDAMAPLKDLNMQGKLLINNSFLIPSNFLCIYFKRLPGFLQKFRNLLVYF